VEDDYDSDFRHHGSPLTALKGLDRCGCVIYLGTFSKSIGAALRLGYMVLPEELVAPARTVKTLLNNGQPWLDQAVLAAFIASGGFANHLRRIRRTYLYRRDFLVEQLHKHFGEVHLSGLEGGMHLTWRIPDDFPDAPRLERMAREEGVGIYSLLTGAAYRKEPCIQSTLAESVIYSLPTGAAYCKGTDELVARTIMLGYSSLGEASIKEGIARIARILAADPSDEAAATDTAPSAV
jgi:GntR family transcriptional regulator/MocR family aminotransferase